MSAVSAPTSAKPSIKNSTAQEEPSSWKETLCKVGKVVLCALIPLASLLIAYWVVPKSWLVVVIPFVAICSVAAAVLCYNKLTDLVDASALFSAKNTKPPEPLPLGAPRGIENSGDNCWAIALAQCLYADVGIREWLKNDACPKKLRAFHDFMHAYEKAVEDNAFVVTMKNRKGNEVDAAQELRKCIARLWTAEQRENGDGISFDHRQEDASEGWQKIYSFLPEHLKSPLHIERTYHRGFNPFRPGPRTDCVYDCLAVPVIGEQAKMEELMKLYLNARGEGDDPTRIDGFDFKRRKTVTRFVDAPPSLWIQFNRFKTDEKEIHTSKGVRVKYITRKVDTPIEIPQKYELPLLNKPSISYELTSFLVHHGMGRRSGHYTSCMKAVDGQWYRVNDDKVEILSPEKVEEASQQAYMVQYTRA